MSGAKAGPAVRLPEALITAAASLLPHDTRERYRQEWIAELQHYRREGVRPGLPALRILRTAPATRHALRSPTRSVADFPVLHALAFAGFRYYFAGSVCRDTGIWLQNTAFIFLVYSMTHSIFALGLVMSAQFAAPLVLGPWMAVVITRFGSHRSLLLGSCMAAIIEGTLAVLLFTERLDMPWILLGAMAIGNVSALAVPAAWEIAPQVMPSEHAAAADTASSLSVNIGKAIAPVFAFTIVASAGYGWAFGCASVSYMVMCIALIVARRMVRAGYVTTPRPAGRQWSFAWRSRSVLILLAVAAAVTAAASPPLVLGPALAATVGAPVSYCAFYLATLGAGAALVSFRPVRRPSPGKISCYLLVLGASTVLFALSPVLWLSLCAATVMGCASLLSSATAQALLMHHSHRENTSAITTIWAAAFIGAGSISALIDGILANTLGVRTAGVLIATPAAIVAVLLIAKSLSRRRRIFPNNHAVATNG